MLVRLWTLLPRLTDSTSHGFNERGLCLAQRSTLTPGRMALPLDPFALPWSVAASAPISLAARGQGDQLRGRHTCSLWGQSRKAHAPSLLFSHLLEPRSTIRYCKGGWKMCSLAGWSYAKLGEWILGPSKSLGAPGSWASTERLQNGISGSCHVRWLRSWFARRKPVLQTSMTARRAMLCQM